MSASRNRKPRNPFSVYFSVFLLAILFVIVGNWNLSPATLRDIAINLASDMIAVIVIFFIFSRVFLIDNDKDSAEMLDGVEIIKRAITPYSQSDNVDDRKNSNWLWNSIKDDSSDKPEDEKDRIKKIAKQVDLLLSDDPDKSELYRLKQLSEYLQKQKNALDNEYRGAKADWQEQKRRFEGELTRAKEDLKQKQELIHQKDKRLDDFSAQLKQLEMEVREGMSSVRRTVTHSFEDVHKGIMHSTGSINSGQINVLKASSAAMVSQLERFENNVSIKLDEAVAIVGRRRTNSQAPPVYPQAPPVYPDGVGVRHRHRLVVEDDSSDGQTDVGVHDHSGRKKQGGDVPLRDYFP